MKVTGTVEYVDLEGGLYRLNGDDGKRYTLLGARSELKSARGARVEVEGSLDEGFGIGMAGPQLRVGRVRKL
jgi:formylmethanofuran dehydrogenase subunit C